jgi:RimJ/RimL family protein N-acetyltransferase
MAARELGCPTERRRSMEIRQVTDADTEAVLAYYADLLAEKLPFILDNPVPTVEQERKFVHEHDGVRAALFLTLFEGRIVAMSGYRISGHPQRSHSCSLGISVAKPFRGQGIGSRLVATGEDWCRSRSVRRLELEVIDGNPAVALYQRLGFDIEGRKREAIKVGNGLRDVIIMAKILV